MNNNIKLNKNKPSFAQCNRMIIEINKSFSFNDIPIKLAVHKSIIEESKYKLLVFNLKEGSDKLPKLKGTYTLTELHNHLFKHFNN